MVAAAVAAFSVLAGTAVADEPEVEDNPPTISGGELSHSFLSYEGGNVQIRAEVTDDIGVSTVSANIFGSDGSYYGIPLYEGFTGNYFGTFEAPPNYYEEPVYYVVEVEAFDTANNYSVSTIGEVQVEGLPRFDQYPELSELLVTPEFLPSTGGTVTISADATDDRSISTVFATIRPPGGGSTEVPLEPVSFSHYEGTFVAPANAGPSAVEYPVEISAQDDIGQETRIGAAGTITVEAAAVPSSGELRLEPTSRDYGSVRVGKEKVRRVIVRNDPLLEGEAVELTVRLTGSPAFSVQGMPTGSEHFVLAPGESREFYVAFSPTAPGEFFGALEFVRADGAQEGLATSLSGVGVGPAR